MRIVGPSARTAMYADHVISQSKIRSLAENFRHGLSPFTGTGTATVLTISFYRFVQPHSVFFNIREDSRDGF
ncbi:MAG: hypothetical protein DMG93_07855 [Acidobacteria bacterium]|nr:MAG: hypothetical protein DMG93_07855 [Acidobacteriota bacterium]